MISIQDYKPSWPQEFESIRTGLQETLGFLALRIDHIGSTAVPGLGAKDIVDVQVAVAALSEEVRKTLITAGYEFRPRATHDHVPAGENDDPKWWAKFMFHQRSGQRRANVHVRIEGYPNQRYALLFRDYLRAHPHSAQSLERVKREIAKRHATDIDAYCSIKDPVCDLIWEAAKAWSKSTGWKPA